MLFKRFFAVFQSGLATFDDFTELFKDHPYMVLDTQLSLGKDNILSEKRDAHAEFSNGDNKDCDKKDDLDKRERRESSIESSYCELPLKRSAINTKKINARAHLKQLIDLTYTTSDLKLIETLESRVKKLLQDFTQKITQGELNDLPQSNTGHQKPKRKNQHQELPTAKKKETSLFWTRWANCGYDVTVLQGKVKITTRRGIEHHTGIYH